MIAIQKAGELPKTIFPTGRRATIQPALTAVAVLFLILLSHAAVADTGWQNLDDVSADTSNWKFDPGAHTVMLILPASPSTHEIVGSWKVRTADDPVGRCPPNLLNSGVFSIIFNHCDLP